MACDICGRGACCNSFHSLEEQKQYEKVIELFDKAREERIKLQTELSQSIEEDT